MLAVVFNGILRTGEIPKGLTRIHVAPLLKAGKDPNACESRRPISLISTAVKVLEGVLYHRIVGEVGNILDPGRFAYRRGRSTEMALAEIMDFAHWPLNSQR